MEFAERIFPGLRAFLTVWTIQYNSMQWYQDIFTNKESVTPFDFLIVPSGFRVLTSEYQQSIALAKDLSKFSQHIKFRLMIVFPYHGNILQNHCTLQSVFLRRKTCFSLIWHFRRLFTLLNKGSLPFPWLSPFPVKDLLIRLSFLTRKGPGQNWRNCHSLLP